MNRQSKREFVAIVHAHQTNVDEAKEIAQSFIQGQRFRIGISAPMKETWIDVFLGRNVSISEEKRNVSLESDR